MVLKAAVVSAAHGAATADEGRYPIWWSPVLELDSLDNVEQRLDRRLWKDWDSGLELYGLTNGRRLTADANNCRELKMLTAVGFHGRGTNGLAIQSGLLAKCRAIEMLGRAQPARRSFVRDFVLNADALYSMPAPLDGPSCDFMCRQLYANDIGLPWSAFETVGRVEVEEENAIKVLEYGWARKIQLVGRADVNGDGVEDLMLIVGSWATQGTLDSTSFFVLTRFSPDAVLQYLNPDLHRCTHYQCDPDYMMPALYPDDEMGRDRMIRSTPQVSGDEPR
jgi:hypothetical protein